MRDKPMTLDDYLARPLLADPFRLVDSCLISDGGAAYVTTTLERARDLRQPIVAVARRRRGLLAHRRALGAAGRVHEHAAGVRRARRVRDGRASRRRDVDVLACYDPFTVVSLMQIEDMGFCPKGEGGAFVEGDTLHFDGGALPFNTHGGLLSHAYVLGIAHVVEIVKQLRGRGRGAGAGREVGVYGGYTGQQASTLVLGTALMHRDDFPLPDVDEPTREFWAGAARGELRIPRCDACARFVLVPRRRRAAAAAATRLTWTAVSGRGRLFSWAVVRRAVPPAFADAVPFVTALVALEEDPGGAPRHAASSTARPTTLARDMPVARRLPAAALPGRRADASIAPMFTPALTCVSGGRHVRARSPRSPASTTRSSTPTRT